VGKGTVVTALRERLPDLIVPVSATTRPPRTGEVDGVHYHFVDDVRFDRLNEEGSLLEWATFAGHRYGTLAATVNNALAAGRTVVLEIDVQGARQIRDRVPGTLLIFLKPPSQKALAERLRGRGTEDDVLVAQRLAIADAELAESGWFDHVVVNDRVDSAVEAIVRILEAPSA
jgi:guanylate kinase